MAATTSEKEEKTMEFTRDKDQYQLISAISTNTTFKATTYEAKFVNPTSEIDIPVRINIVNMYNLKNISSFIDEIHEAETYEHENIVKVHRSFKSNDDLWIIMPSLSRLSLRSVIQSDFENGLSLPNIAFILKQTLAALSHMHANNKAHRNLHAGCIFLDCESRVKIALRSLAYEESGYPSWAVVCNKNRDEKAMDVWMLGLLALELFYGRIPVSNFAAFRGLVFEIYDEFGVKEKRHGCSLGFFSYFGRGGQKKIPVALGELLAACFSTDPAKMATMDMLLECEIFKKRWFGGAKSLAKLKKTWSN